MSDTKKTHDDTSPRIYVACLAAYNNGKLHGRWIDAAQDPDDIGAEIEDMLAASPEPDAEEWAIHDYEGFRGIELSEYEDLETVAKLASLITEHGDLAAGVYAHAGTVEETARLIEDCYQGAWSSLEAWGEDYLEQTGQLDSLPENLRCYFDCAAFARDCELGGDIFTIETPDGQVHVFSR